MDDSLWYLNTIILMRSGYPICVVKMEDRDEYMYVLEKASVDSSLGMYLYIVG